MRKFAILQNPSTTFTVCVLAACSLIACGSGPGGGVNHDEDNSLQSPPIVEPAVVDAPTGGNPLDPSVEPLAGISISQLNDVIGSAAQDSLPLDLKVYACIVEDPEKCEATPVMDDHAPNTYLIRMQRSLHTSKDLDLVVETRLVFSTVSRVTPWGRYVPVLYRSTGGILEVLKAGRIMTANNAGHLATKTMHYFDVELGRAIVQYGIEGFGVALIAIDPDSANEDLIKVKQTDAVSIGGKFQQWISSTSPQVELTLITRDDETKAFTKVCGQTAGTVVSAHFYSMRRTDAGSVIDMQRPIEGGQVLVDGCVEFVGKAPLHGYGNTFVLSSGWPGISF